MTLISSEPKPLIVASGHIIVILFAYSSPFWLDWRLVAVGVTLYYIQIAVFNGCILSLAQFKGERISFHEWYLTKWGIPINRTKLKFFLDNILPFIFLSLALIVQLALRLHPVINL